MSDSVTLNPPPFTEGELLIWEVREGHVREGGGQLVRRQVGFKRLDRGRAVIAWGVDSEGKPALFTADPLELRRPAPPAPAAKIEPPTPPPPEPVTSRRAVLRRAQNAWLEAQALARRADELVHRARQAFADVEFDLQRLGDLEAHAAAAAIERIRTGCADPAPDISAADWGEREIARHRCEAARAAFNRLEAEAAEAWSYEREADKARRQAAKYVLEGLAQLFIGELAEVEAAAAQRRVEATALSLLWVDGGSLRLGSAADGIIAAGPAQIVDPVGLRQQLVEQRQAPWQALFNRLLVDAEADLDPEPPE